MGAFHLPSGIVNGQVERGEKTIPGFMIPSLPQIRLEMDHLVLSRAQELHYPLSKGLSRVHELGLSSDRLRPSV